MIRNALFVFALGGSALLHITIAGISPQPQTGLAGGSVSDNVALGSGFDDLVQGALTPVETPLLNLPETPHNKTENTPIASSNIANTADSAPLTSIEPAAFSDTQIPVTSAAHTHSDIRQPITHLGNPPQKPSPLTPVKPAPSLETVIAQIPTSKLAAARSDRPQTRPKRPSSQQQAQAPKQQQSQRPIAPRGNANTNTSRGESTGRQAGTNAHSSRNQGPTSHQAGNAAISSYWGTVLRQIRRAPGGQAGRKGIVSIRITISANGRLQNVTLIKSSGNNRVDRVALRKIQNVRRFQPTPTGRTETRKLYVDVKR